MLTPTVSVQYLDSIAHMLLLAFGFDQKKVLQGVYKLVSISPASLSIPFVGLYLHLSQNNDSAYHYSIRV